MHSFDVDQLLFNVLSMFLWFCYLSDHSFFVHLITHFPLAVTAGREDRILSWWSLLGFLPSMALDVSSLWMTPYSSPASWRISAGLLENLHRETTWISTSLCLEFDCILCKHIFLLTTPLMSSSSSKLLTLTIVDSGFCIPEPSDLGRWAHVFPHILLPVFCPDIFSFLNPLYFKSSFSF